MKKILLILSLFACTTMVQAKDLDVTVKHKVKQPTGLTLISIDGMWAELRLSSKSDSCQVLVRDTPVNGNRIMSDECTFITNSKNLNIICTKDKSICKTKLEVENYADTFYNKTTNRYDR